MESYSKVILSITLILRIASQMECLSNSFPWNGHAFSGRCGSVLQWETLYAINTRSTGVKVWRMTHLRIARWIHRTRITDTSNQSAGSRRPIPAWQVPGGLRHICVNTFITWWNCEKLTESCSLFVTYLRTFSLHEKKHFQSLVTLFDTFVTWKYYVFDICVNTFITWWNCEKLTESCSLFVTYLRIFSAYEKILRSISQKVAHCLWHICENSHHMKKIWEVFERKLLTVRDTPENSEMNSSHQDYWHL